MDYEKKYKEALERARHYYLTGKGEPVDFIKMIFPELAESDDERIRKAIHIYLDWLDGRNKDYQPKGDYSIKDMIAWLEKQKEYESTDFEYVWDRTDCGALTSALDKYSKEAIINMCHAWYDKGIELERKSWLEKQGEKKPQRMISAEAKEAMYDKPALREEDEQHIDSLLKRLDGLCRNEFERTRFAISEDRDWLTSLKERIE